MKKILVLIVVVSFCSCYAPYSFRVRKIESQNNRLLLLMQLTSKFPYIILHDNIGEWKLTNVSIIDNNSIMAGSLEVLPSSRKTFTVVDEKKVNKAKSGYDKPFDEIHIWLSSPLSSNSNQVKFSDKDINRVQIYQAVSSGGGKAIIGLSVVGAIFLVIIGALYASNF